MAMEMTDLQLSAQVGSNAEISLREGEEQNLARFLLSLSLELSHEGKPVDSRILVGNNSFEWIGSCVSTYYEALEPHMETIIKLAANFADKDNIPAAIEFWIGICNVEMKKPCPPYRFIDIGKYTLVPKLLENILKEGGNGMCKMSMAGGTCLGVVARTVGDSIIRLVIFFVQDKLSECDDVSREAGAYVFGSILEGPSVQELSSVALVVLHLLTFAMEDDNCHVKETIMWTMTRILKLLHSAGFFVISVHRLERVIEVLLKSIKTDSPDVVKKVCEAIYYFARGYHPGFNNDHSPCVLSLYRRDIIDALISTADTTSDLKLKSAAYKTLSEVVKCSKKSQYIEQLLSKVVYRLKQTLDTTNQQDLPSLLCGVLLEIMQNLNSTEETKQSISQAADDIMFLFMKIFCDYGCLKEAMLATGALAYAIGQKFNKYIHDFSKFMLMGLDNSQVCGISVGVVSDICRALGGEMLPYSDDIMELLFKNLSSRDLRPLIFTCFGDVALAIGKNFGKHVDPVMIRMSKEAADAQVVDVEYGKQLKMSILEVYSGIWQVVKTLEGDLKLTRYAPQILNFIEVVVKDPHRDERLGKAAVALIGDIAIALGDITVFNLNMSS